MSESGRGLLDDPMDSRRLSADLGRARARRGVTRRPAGQRRVFEWGSSASRDLDDLRAPRPRDSRRRPAARRAPGRAAGPRIARHHQHLVRWRRPWSSHRRLVGARRHLQRARPLVGGALVDAVPWGWRAIFFINPPLLAVAWWLTRTGVAELPGRRSPRAPHPTARPGRRHPRRRRPGPHRLSAHRGPPPLRGCGDGSSLRRRAARRLRARRGPPATADAPARSFFRSVRSPSPTSSPSWSTARWPPALSWLIVHVQAHLGYPAVKLRTCGRPRGRRLGPAVLPGRRPRAPSSVRVFCSSGRSTR